MQIEQFVETMAATSADQKTAIAMCADDLEGGSHADWLEKWHLFRDNECKLIDNCPIANELLEKINQLSVQLATTLATTLKDATAQIEWLKEDLGCYFFGNATPAHDMIFDPLLKTVEQIGRQAIN